MTKKTKYFHLILLIICSSIFMNCKSDKSKIGSNKVEIETTPNVSSEKKGSEKYHSIENTESISDSINNVQTSVLDTSQNKKTETVQNIPTKPIIKKQPTKPIPVKMPKIQFEELVWNFGEITEGDIIEKKFKFVNTGDAALEIIATSATCGCTRPSFPFLDIAPGESNVIGVSYNSVGKEGEQNPEVTIESNTIPKITTIKLHGTVKPKPKDKKVDSNTIEKDTVNSKQ